MEIIFKIHERSWKTFSTCFWFENLLVLIKHVMGTTVYKKLKRIEWESENSGIELRLKLKRHNTQQFCSENRSIFNFKWYYRLQVKLFALVTTLYTLEYCYNLPSFLVITVMIFNIFFLLFKSILSLDPNLEKFFYLFNFRTSSKQIFHTANSGQHVMHAEADIYFKTVIGTLYTLYT